jgi:hypothetical protein
MNDDIEMDILPDEERYKLHIETHYKNEYFLISLYQAVSLSAPVGLASQSKQIICLIGIWGLVIMITAFSLAAISTIVAAYFKYQQKMFEIKANAAQKRNSEYSYIEESKRSNNTMNIMRRLFLLSACLIGLGFTAFPVAFVIHQLQGETNVTN